MGASGDEPWLTRYVGSRTSERRVRIYRKDQEDAVLGELLGPLMRVEVVLRKDWAERWWSVWERDDEAGKRAAATAIEDMTGVRVWGDEREEMPGLVRPDQCDEAQRVLAFLEQYGDAVQRWSAAGLDVLGLAKEAADAKRLKCDRVTRWRGERRAEELQRMGASEIEAMVRVLLHRGGPRAASAGVAV